MKFFIKRLTLCNFLESLTAEYIYKHNNCISFQKEIESAGQNWFKIYKYTGKVRSINQNCHAHYVRSCLHKFLRMHDQERYPRGKSAPRVPLEKWCKNKFAICFISGITTHRKDTIGCRCDFIIIRVESAAGRFPINGGGGSDILRTHSQFI